MSAWDTWEPVGGLPFALGRSPRSLSLLIAPVKGARCEQTRGGGCPWMSTCVHVAQRPDVAKFCLRSLVPYCRLGQGGGMPAKASLKVRPCPDSDRRIASSTRPPCSQLHH